VEVTVSVPGKLFLAGEYAVTRGGPALVAAVSRRLHCRARARSGQAAIALRSRACSFRMGPGAGEPEKAPRELRFVAFAARLATHALGLDDLELEIETESALDDLGAEKTGLGGSAAATVATVSAIWAVAGRDAVGDATLQQRLAIALLAHRVAQGGGSGADVVASTAGGVVAIEGLDSTATPRSLSDAILRLPQAPPVSFERLELPAGLSLEAVGTGRAAASGPRASRFAAACEGPERRLLDAWATGMRVAVEEFIAALRDGSSEATLRACAGSGRWLERLAPLVPVPICTPRLRLACAIARRCGGVGRVSGAGGGDCAIALVRDDRRMELRDAWRRAGLSPLEVYVDTGPRIEAQPGGSGDGRG
jgi:phosphomevalonate kinase